MLDLSYLFRLYTAIKGTQLSTLTNLMLLVNIFNILCFTSIVHFKNNFMNYISI
jgi:hypothetical protein